MTGQTKMIIITSDEDIIRQFSFKKSQNTHIIDLDTNKQHALTDTDGNNMVDMALLAELSKLNSTNDQVYKRALDSPQQNPSKPAKTPRKSLDMICAICGDRAIGFNYDVLSCASCKAFFRRNANQPAERVRCLTGRGDCSVAHETRRKCQKCRLEKCFGSGMRKDFILSEEEKQYRKKRLEDNRKVTTQRLSTSDYSTSSSSVSNVLSNPPSASPETDDLSQLLANVSEEDLINYEDKIDLNDIDDASFELMSVEDWITVESLRSAFLENFQKTGPKPAMEEITDRTSALISWSHMANQQALSVIKFFRQVHEFEILDADDRFTLIKYNLFPLYPIIKTFLYNPQNYCSAETGEEAAKHQRFMKLFFSEECIKEMFYNLTLLLVGITEQDTGILALLLTVLMFYQGLSMSEHEPSLKDPLAVYEAQSFYTKVLWNYMVNKWGEETTCRRFSKLLTTIFRMQSGAKIFREYCRSQFNTSEAVDQLAPLIQTVLQIS